MKRLTSIPGLTDDQSAEVLRIVNRVLTPEVRIWLFGSRAAGTFRQYSDVDLLLETTSGPPISDQALRQLQQAFEDSELPYKFDIVRDEDLAATFRTRVEAIRLLLWNDLAMAETN